MDVARKIPWFFLAVSAVTLIVYSYPQVVGASDAKVVDPSNSGETVSRDALLFTKPAFATQVNRGDLIIFQRGNITNSTMSLRRVVDIRETNNSRAYRVSGDGTTWVEEEKVLSKTVFSLPFMGYLVIFLSTIPGFFVLVILPSVIILYGEINSILGELRRDGNRGVIDEEY